MKKVKSSHIDSYNYHPESKKLVVRFKNGHEYGYHGVELHEFAALESADSTGKHLIKHVFPHKKGTKLG